MTFIKLSVVLFITFIYGKAEEVCFSVNGDGNSQASFCTIGMGDRRIKDEAITASSSFDYRHLPHFGRLDNQESLRGNTPNIGAWVSRYNRVGEWIQVDLQKPTRLTGVITQGRPRVHQQWVVSFKISYGDSPNHMHVICDKNGKDVVFQGNNDPECYATNKFPAPVVARYVRLYPQSWNAYMTLRMEYLTC